MLSDIQRSSNTIAFYSREAHGNARFHPAKFGQHRRDLEAKRSDLSDESRRQRWD